MDSEIVDNNFLAFTHFFLGLPQEKEDENQSVVDVVSVSITLLLNDQSKLTVNKIFEFFVDG